MVEGRFFQFPDNVREKLAAVFQRSTKIALSQTGQNAFRAGYGKWFCTPISPLTSTDTI